MRRLSRRARMAGIPVIAGYECSGDNCFSRVSEAKPGRTPRQRRTRVLTINGGQARADGLTLTFNTVTAAGNTTFRTSNTGFPTAPPALPLGRSDASGGKGHFCVATTATVTGNTTARPNYTNLGPPAKPDSRYTAITELAGRTSPAPEALPTTFSAAQPRAREFTRSLLLASEQHRRRRPTGGRSTRLLYG